MEKDVASTKHQTPISQWSFALRNYACGFIAGAANVVSGYPFDAIKVRLQSHPSAARNGMWRTCVHAFKHERFSWMFRGASAPALGTGLETGINYLVFSEVFRQLKVGPEDDVATVVRASLLAGGLAGVPVSLVISPVELIKCRTQLSHTLKMGSTPTSAVKYIIKADGYKGFSRGMSATLAREIPGNAVFFSVYNGLTKVLPQEEVSSRCLSSLTAGGMAGMAFWTAIFPFDLIKTRLQITSSKKNKSLLGELSKVYRQQGMKGLYAGLTPTLIRAFPANAVQWLAWDLTSRWLRVEA